MSIKSRLTLSNIAMILIPLTFSALLTLIFGSMFLKEIRQDRVVKFLQQSGGTQSDMTAGALIKEVRRTTIQTPEKFLDNLYTGELDRQFEALNLALIVRKDDTVIYSSGTVSNDLKNYSLPPFRFPRSTRPEDNKPSKPSETRPLFSFDKVNIMDQQDFYFTDNSKGTVFIVSDSTYLKKTEKYAKYLITSILAVMILTNILLTLLVARSIVKPLEILKRAANELKNGNLDYELTGIGNDEIGEVSSAFEDARVRLRESEAMTLQYENNRKELISNITHDLKTPVTAIKGYIEGIKDGVADTPEKMEKYIETIYSKANYMDRLIDELFLFSKLDLNKLPFNFENIDIVKYLEDCCEELQFDLEDKNIVLRSKFEPPSGGIIVKGDREKLRRVIINIVGNASKYMDKTECYIDIILRDRIGFVEIEIADNGKGIGNDSIPFIFDRFYREDLSRNTLTGGSGLGLAISKLIVEEHGGKIWAESIPGEGTSIFFTLKKLEKGSEDTLKGV